MDDYDEDLLQNPFFKALSTKGKSIYQQAVEDRRTVRFSHPFHTFDSKKPFIFMFYQIVLLFYQ